MKDEARWDSVVRLVGGAVLIGLGLGGAFLASGVGGFCPIYAVLQVRTNSGNAGT